MLTACALGWYLAIPAGEAVSSTPTSRLIPHGGWAYPRLNSTPTVLPQPLVDETPSTGMIDIPVATQQTTPDTRPDTLAPPTPTLASPAVASTAMTPMAVPPVADMAAAAAVPTVAAYPIVAPPAPPVEKAPPVEMATPDPMAPRPDAPVFRLRQNTEPAPQQAATPATGEGARYYSIHRQAGRTPDTPRLPDPVYLDALPVELNNLPDSQDLAEPPAPPALTRDSQGRIRPAIDPDTDPSFD